MREKSPYYIHSSGGLLSIQFIQRLRQQNVKEKYMEPAAFSMPGQESLAPSELDKKMTNVWKSLLEKWFTVSRPIKKYNLSEARKKWIIPFLEALDYNPQYLKKDTPVSEEKKTFLSHRGGDWPHAPIIHTVAPCQDLDEKITKGRGEKSPHDALQMYLNENREDQWGIVTNGKVLRILRDYYHTYTKGYVEFDLEAIFEERSFSDFLALYRLIHPSRFIPDEEGIPPIEHFYRVSLAAGEKIGNELRANVKNAIEALGNGFLTKELRDNLIKDPEECKAYYQEILHVIYRIIFLLFAEQRGMLPTRDSLYAEAYSITKLRERAEKTKRRDRHCDLWKGLLVTFDIVGRGVDDPESKLRAFGYNGSLYDESKIERLKDLKCENTDILDAVRNLTYFESEHTLQRISYVDLGVEEIGSIYESLLDYTPRVLSEDVELDGKLYTGGTFYLDPRGAARKSTGSYYTDPRLISELIQSALKPVLEDRLTGKESSEEKETALLFIRVCDPACGSGAFLIAATNFLGKELARMRTGTDYPPEEEERKARRDVLQHCIYGVDFNPMAVELAKVSLWINACVKDMPLNFLDHHIKCGNSLIGTTPELLEKGIPDEAFNPVTGDDVEFVKRIKKINRDQRQVRTLEEVKKELEERKLVIEYEELSDIEERKPEDVEKKKEKYDSIIESPEWHHRKVVADAWTAAFFWSLNSNSPPPPTEAVLRMLKRDKKAEKVNKLTLEKIEELAREHRFFHWHLEFPDVFSGSNPGFDCVLGNPPWDKVQAEEEQWFIGKNDKIATSSGEQRKNIIKELKNVDPILFEEWKSYLYEINHMKKLFKGSSLYPLTSPGILNNYQLFSERNLGLINSKGRTGNVIASGIATDYYSQFFFQKIMNKGQLVSLYDFENKEGIFPVHRSYKFSLLTLNGSGSTTESADFAFFLTNLDQLKDENRHFTLSEKDIEILNPNTRTCLIFRDKKDSIIVKKIYQKNEVLLYDDPDMQSPFDVRIHRMFNVTDDDWRFLHAWEKSNDTNALYGDWRKNRKNAKMQPIYESKLIWHYDHRFATYQDVGSDDAENRKPRKTDSNNKASPDYEIFPRDWVDTSEILKKSSRWSWQNEWFFSVRDVTNATNERTVVAAITPFAGSVNSINHIFASNAKNACLLLSNLNSYVCDYVARQKIGSQHLNQWSLKQLPIVPRCRYDNIDEDLLNHILDLTLKLTYTSASLRPFACDLGYDGLPFRWNAEERECLKAELDAITAHLYNVTREELDYIMETFPREKLKDINRYGEYRAKKLILEYYDKYASRMNEVKR